MIQIHRGFQATKGRLDVIQAGLQALQNSVGEQSLYENLKQKSYFLCLRNQLHANLYFKVTDESEENPVLV